MSLLQQFISFALNAGTGLLINAFSKFEFRVNSYGPLYRTDFFNFIFPRSYAFGFLADPD